jgi:hypothetical protein
VRSAARGWSPLVAGETAARAIAAAAAIARDLSGGPGQAALGPGLGGGRTGLALLFAYLERSLGDAAAGERALLLLDQAVDGLAEQPAPPASLYHGYAGIAWVTEHLAWGESSDGDEDPNADVDEALLSNLRRTPWQGEIDLLGGLVGWGVYALERLPRPAAAAMLDLVVARLGESAECGASGIIPAAERGTSGINSAAGAGAGRIGSGAEHGASGTNSAAGAGAASGTGAAEETDLGMAHGAAGVIALLAHVQAAAPSPPAAALLTRTVEGVLELVSARDQGEEGDLAWCAGDAGLAVALLAAARALSRADWERAARSLAAAAAERYPGGAGSAEDHPGDAVAKHHPGDAAEPERADAQGFDPALCHGTAGLSHLFHRLYRSTGDPALLAAARRWLERTLARRRPGQGVGGYLRRGRGEDGKFGWVADPGFLSGAAGIGLALLAAATPVEPAWDRLLLLSGRTGR